VFAAGCGFNFLVAVAAFALVAWGGVEQDAPYPAVVGPVQENASLFSAGLRRGDRILEIAQQPVTTWERNLSSQPPGFLDAVAKLARAKNPHPLACLIERRDKGRATVLLLTVPPAGQIVKELSAGAVQQMLAPCCIGGVQPYLPAHKAGIKRGDVVLAIEGRPIESYDQMRDVVSASLGKALEFRIKRGADELHLTVTPVDRGTTLPTGMIGVFPGNVEREWFKVGFFESWAIGARQATHLTRQVAVGTFGLFARFRLREMKQSLAGPLGIFGMTYQNAREGWASFLFNMALLNIALMVLNILPIPILDGGHILITTIESVTRRPVPTRWLAGIYYVFFALIIALLLMTTWFDVLRFASWFGVTR
jgi:regulator of sigma E protease